MPYHVRLMRQGDINQVTAIDREAFPTQLPPANYQHELRNPLACYIVAYDEEKTVEEPVVKASPGKGLTRLVARFRQLFSHDHLSSDEPSLSTRHYIIGFAGFWTMTDEAHITSIAVREAYHQQGIGELLLISVIDLATELKNRIVTLEVRASNTVAQNLYYKYGFTEVGVRRGYYTDNREDGVLMSTQDINSAAFQTHVQQLKQVHSRKWGISPSQIGR